MKRKIVKIDEMKCNGCGLCVPSCAEGAIQIIDGKARLLADKLCDGLGACLGDCPLDAITIEEREADDFDEAAVAAHLDANGEAQPHHAHPASGSPVQHGGGCPSAQVRSFTPSAGSGCPSAQPMSRAREAADERPTAGPAPSRLAQWPVQLHLVPPTAPFLREADVLLAADCVAFAYAGFHEELLKGRVLLIACPKLDDTRPYLDKLVAMIQQSRVRSLTVAHMEVPCCSGLIHLARQAIAQSGQAIPLETVRIGISGERK